MEVYRVYIMNRVDINVGKHGNDVNGLFVYCPRTITPEMMHEINELIEQHPTAKTIRAIVTDDLYGYGSAITVYKYMTNQATKIVVQYDKKGGYHEQ